MTRSGSGDRRLTRRPGVLLAVGATLALAIAALGVHAAAGAALRGPGLAVGWSVALAALFAFAALTVASRYRSHTRTTDVSTTALDRLRQATVAVLFASAVLVPTLLIVLHRPLPGNAITPYGTPTPSLSRSLGPGDESSVYPSQKPASGRHFSFDLTALLWTLLVGLGIALALGLVAFGLRALRGLPESGPVESAPPTAEAGEDEALADALLAGRSALAGDDARTAIIACYAAMESSLGSAGVPRELADSPSDLLRRAKTRDLPGTGTRDAAALTDLFREARYSTHPMTAKHLASARAALDSVTAALTERIREREAELAKAGADTNAGTGAHPASGTGVSAP